MPGWRSSSTPHFVSIKVDREERPDVDRVYMLFVQATTGLGRLADERVADAGRCSRSTAAPTSRRPAAGAGPGFVEILTELARAWREERDKLERSAVTIVERLRSYGQTERRRGRGRHRRARQGRGGVLGGLRPPARRLRQRAEVSAPERADVPAARACPDRRGRAARHGAADAAGDGAGRHARPPGRRVPPLLGGRRRGACRTSRRCSTTRRSWCTPTWTPPS